MINKHCTPFPEDCHIKIKPTDLISIIFSLIFYKDIKKLDQARKIKYLF